MLTHTPPPLFRGESVLFPPSHKVGQASLPDIIMTDGDGCPTNRGEIVVFPLYQEGIKGCVLIRKSRWVLLCKTQPNFKVKQVYDWIGLDWIGLD